MPRGRPKKSPSPSDLPSGAVEALEEIGHPVDAVLEACREVGLNRDQASALIRRLAVQKAGFRSHIEKLTTRGLIRDIEGKLALIMQYLDEFSIAGASPRDLAIIFGILVEKRQLLLGEPTQILSTQERKHINDLMPALVEEAKRRGMTIDLSPGDYSEIGREGRTARVVQGERPRPQAGRGKVINRSMLANKRD